MFDAKRLLGDFIAGQVGQRMGEGSRGGSAGLGGGGSGALAGIARTIGQNPALAGGLASLILGSKKGRSFGGSAAKLGGLAMIGSLAYRAFQSWQASQGGPASGRGSAVGGDSPASGGSFLGGAGGSPWGQARPAGFAAPPDGSAFAPTGEEAQQALSRALLRAMIAAAKADGDVDTAEQEAIFEAMDRYEMGPADKAFVMDELRAPLDVDAVARSARNPEEAAEIYAASLLAIDVDNPAERGYLALLAARLKLEEGLVAHLHATIEEAGREAA